MKTTRLKQMEHYIGEKGSVTIKELCEHFQIHPNTARSDVQTLVENGVAEKKYGKVTASVKIPLEHIDMKPNNNAKEKIGFLAAKLLEEDDIIYMDAGTTVPMMLTAGTALPRRLTIVTNSIDTIHWASVHTDYTVFVLPGQVDRRLNSILSLETIDSMKSYKINKAFIGIRGVSDNGELLSSSGIDARMKNTVLSMCRDVFMLADSRKACANNAIYSFSSLDRVRTWICDEPTPEVVRLCSKFGVTLITKE